MKGLVYILIALFIDSLQLMLSLAIAAAGSALGLFTGISLPLGFAIGFAVNFTISVVIGTPLVLALAMDGMFAPTRTILTYLGELVPGANNLPLWTVLVTLCLLRKRAMKGGFVGMVAGLASFAVPGGQIRGVPSTNRKFTGVRTVVAAARAEAPTRPTTPTRVALHDIRVSRAANNDNPQTSYGMAA